MELHKMLEENELRNCKVLVYANKQDLPNSMNVSQIIDKLNLPSLNKSNEWFIQGCSALTGEGLFEGLDWVSKQKFEKK